MVTLNPESHRGAKMQLLSSNALKSLRCSVWLMYAKHVLVDRIPSLTISSSFLNYFFICTSCMARFPTCVSQWLEFGKFRSLSFKYSFDFSSHKILRLPWCSCSPHVYVHDMVKQETPSEAESRQLLITAAATRGSIWKYVTSSNHWV